MVNKQNNTSCMNTTEYHTNTDKFNEPSTQLLEQQQNRTGLIMTSIFPVFLTRTSAVSSFVEEIYSNVSF